MDGPTGLTREQLSLIYNNSDDLIFLIAVNDGDYSVLSVNRRYLEMAAIEADSVANRPLAEIFGPAEFAYLKSRYDEAVAAGGPLQYETRSTLNGQTIYLGTTLVPVFEAGECVYIIGVSRDITAAKLEGKALIQEKRRAERYLDIAQAIIIALDADARVMMVNRKGYEILGYPEGSLTDTDWMALIADDELRRSYQTGYRDALAAGLFPDKLTVRIRTYDGDVRLINWSTALIHDDEGEIAGVLASGEDITERSKAEQAMIATQRIAAAGEVVSAVAHDFNNALQGILGNIELAMTDANLSDDTGEFLRTASSLANDAAERIRLLQRLASADSAPTDDEVDLSGLLREVVIQTRHLWQDEAQKRGHTITVRQTLGDGVIARGNSSELRTAFYNVIKNAVEALPDGGTIHVRAGISGDRARVAIADDGEGMDEETVSRIFQPFFSTRGYEVGRGLGMSAVHTIVSAHRGTVKVSATRPGEGTEIEILLPLANSTPQDNDKDDDRDVMKILWVDDDPAIRKLAERFLERLGHEGSVVGNGEEALALLADGHFDVVITDIGMPGMNGYEVSKRVNEMTGGKLPVVALTGWGESVTEEERQEYGVNLILAKPISLASLQEVLGSLAVI